MCTGCDTRGGVGQLLLLLLARREHSRAWGCGLQWPVAARHAVLAMQAAAVLHVPPHDGLSTPTAAIRRHHTKNAHTRVRRAAGRARRVCAPNSRLPRSAAPAAP